MKKYLIFFKIFFLVSGLIPIEGNADVGIGLGYPFIGLKYDFIPEISGEVKYANTGEGVWVAAGRGYCILYQTGLLRAFAGLEFGRVEFDTQDLKGQGMEAAVFLGGEYKILPSLGVALDIAPTMINLYSQSSKSNELEWVVTAGVYWYVF